MNRLGRFLWLGLAANFALAFECLPRKTRNLSPSLLMMSNSLECNEFSRKIETDKILKTSSGNKRRTRDYTLTVTATEDECELLAKRFELMSLSSLSADLSLRPSKQYSRTSGFMTVYVEGSISATLTQTCVRTNENFEVDVEFPIKSIVKPVANNFLLEENNEEDSSSYRAKTDRNFKNTNLKNLNDITELQNILDQMEDEDDEDLLVEDESIYSLISGNLDVGELVAQSFWLNLDPYPKSPGSGPIEISISG